MVRLIGWLSAFLLTLGLAGPAQAEIFFAEKLTPEETRRTERAIEMAVVAIPELREVVEDRNVRVMFTRNSDVYEAMEIFGKHRGISIPRHDAHDKEKSEPLGAHYRNPRDPKDVRIVLADTIYTDYPEAYLVYSTMHELVHCLNRYQEHTGKRPRRQVSIKEDSILEEIETYERVERAIVAFANSPRYQEFLDEWLEPRAHAAFTAGTVRYVRAYAGVRQMYQKKLAELRARQSKTAPSGGGLLFSDIISLWILVKKNSLKYLRLTPKRRESRKSTS